MGKIFYILGKSATGKDTIFKRLMQEAPVRFDRIIPYTTRPIRDGETDGVEYYFVDEAKLEQLEAAGRVIELRSYHTVYGIWKYLTVDDGQIDLMKGNYLMIGVLESYVRTREFFGADCLVPILIDVEDGERIQRALDRERTQDEPKYEEMCRRFLADSADFSEDKIKAAHISKRFDNHDLEECMQNIIKYIEESVS